MGIDMIIKATDTFQRKQRRCLDSFDEPSLFSSTPQLRVAVVAVPNHNHVFHADDEYRLSLSGSALQVIHGVTPVGRIENPPPSVLEIMRGPLPSVYGRVVKLFSLTGKAELQLVE